MDMSLSELWEMMHKVALCAAIHGVAKSDKTGWLNSSELTMYTMMLYIIILFLSGDSHGQRILLRYIPYGHKESDMIELA